MAELLIGCGHSRKKRVTFEQIPAEFSSDLVTLDISARCKPDVVHDLRVMPLPFADNRFDEIHAYEVLEHAGQQGDFKLFFEQFNEFWRILKPGGFFVATVPMWDSPWAWGDPSHTRVIPKQALFYLDQHYYDDQLGRTSASDFRDYYHGDFETFAVQETEHNLGFVLRARK